jgi:hypothetical protein
LKKTSISSSKSDLAKRSGGTDAEMHDRMRKKFQALRSAPERVRMKKAAPHSTGTKSAVINSVVRQINAPYRVAGLRHAA